MRVTTKWAISGYIGWAVARVIASATAPSWSSFDANGNDVIVIEQILRSNFWVYVSRLALYAAVILTLISIYINLMDKTINKTIHGDEISATGGSSVATRGSSIAQGASTIVNSRISNSQVSDTMRKISSYAESAALSERDRRSLDLIAQKLSGAPPVSTKEAESYFEDILDIFKDSGEILNSVRKLVSALKSERNS